MDDRRARCVVLSPSSVVDFFHHFQQRSAFALNFVILCLRVGDEFRIGADGRRLTTIRFGEKDTLASLVTTISRAIGSVGRAEIVKENGVERIKITPRNGKAIRIDSGRSDRDALPGLGLTQGIVATTDAGRGALKTYGLGLVGLKLDSAKAITSAKAELSAAISIIRQAYDSLLNPNA